ncbi:MAG: helix-turn-helix transcriptional regulator [Lactobacillales bacterium]|nr:helix-turn-helix transcriptional regulator [Lactobacillales bacterium]
MITNNLLHEQYDTFRENIKYYRKKLNLTQEELAEKADISISYIKQIESNKEFKNVSLTVILKLSKALDVSVDKLFIIKIKTSV